MKNLILERSLYAKIKDSASDNDKRSMVQRVSLLTYTFISLLILLCGWAPLYVFAPVLIVIYIDYVIMYDRHMRSVPTFNTSTTGSLLISTFFLINIVMTTLIVILTLGALFVVDRYLTNVSPNIEKYYIYHPIMFSIGMLKITSLMMVMGKLAVLAVSSENTVIKVPPITRIVRYLVKCTIHNTTKRS